MIRITIKSGHHIQTDQAHLGFNCDAERNIELPQLNKKSILRKIARALDSIDAEIKLKKGVK